MATGPIPIISDALKKRLQLALATQGGDLANEFLVAFDRAFEIANLTIENAVFPQETLQLNSGGATATLGGAGFELLGDADVVVGYVRVDPADISLLKLKSPTGSVMCLDMNADATLLMGANLSVNGVSAINQAVETTSSPTFVNLDITSMASDWTNAGITIADLGIVTTVDIDGGTIDENIIGGTVAAAGTFTNLTADTDLTLATGATVTAILDEDNMASDSATALATQQSIKAFVDAAIASSDSWAESLAVSNVSGANDVIITAGQEITTDTIAETTAAAGVIVDGLKIKDTGVAGQLDTALAGTVSVTINTAAVTGSGTAFDTELMVGDAIIIAGEIFSVLTIADATNLTIDSNHLAGASGVTANTDSDILIIRNGDTKSRVTFDKTGTILSNVPAAGDGTGGKAIKDGKSNALIQLGEYGSNDFTVTNDDGAYLAEAFFLGDDFIEIVYGGISALSFGVVTGGGAISIAPSVARMVLQARDIYVGSESSAKISFYGNALVSQQAQTTDLKDLITLFGFYSSGANATPLDLDGGTLTAGAIVGTSLNDGTVTLTSGTVTGTWVDLGAVTTIDINGGTVDGAIIGGAVAAAITGTDINATGEYKVDGTKVIGNQAAAEADVTVTQSANPVTANGSVTIADGAAPTNDEIYELAIETDTKLASLLAKLRTHGIIAT